MRRCHALLLFGFIPLLLSSAPAAPTAPDLWKVMAQERGIVVLLRHAQTTPGTGDPPNFSLTDCATQRNLSPQGRAQAERIGAAFRAKGVRVLRLLSSQWCRCLDTARLLGLGTVRPYSALNSFFESTSSEPAQTRQVRAAISAHRLERGVIVMVTHQVNITALSGVVPPMGGAVLVRADADGETRVLGQLQDW